jgi:hypothetical protein
MEPAELADEIVEEWLRDHGDLDSLKTAIARRIVCDRTQIRATLRRIVKQRDAACVQRNAARRQREKEATANDER